MACSEGLARRCLGAMLAVSGKHASSADSADTVLNWRIAATVSRNNDMVRSCLPRAARIALGSVGSTPCFQSARNASRLPDSLVVRE